MSEMRKSSGSTTQDYSRTSLRKEWGCLKPRSRERSSGSAGKSKDLLTHSPMSKSRESNRLDVIWKWGMVILGLCAVAGTIESCVNRTSRNEDNWRNATSPHFQQDFPPGHYRR